MVTADEEGVLLRQGETLRERSATDGAERWSWSGADYRIVGCELGAGFALVLSKVTVTTPSEDPFEFAKQTEELRLTCVDRATGAVRFERPALRDILEGVALTDDTIFDWRVQDGVLRLEARDASSGAERLALDVPLPPPWWRVWLVPSADALHIVGIHAPQFGVGGDYPVEASLLLLALR